MKKFFILVFFCVVFLAASAEGALADTLKAPASTPCKGDPTRECITLESPLKTADPNNPSKSIDVVDIEALIGRIIKTGLGVVGSVTLLVFVWGFFLMLTSAGNAERVAQGTKTVLWAAIGIIVIFSAYMILDTFLKYLTGDL